MTSTNTTAVTSPATADLRPHHLARALGLPRSAASTRRLAAATAILAQDDPAWDFTDRRYCSHCRADLPVEEFYSRSDGTYSNVCKTAVRAQTRRNIALRAQRLNAQREAVRTQLRTSLTAVAALHHCGGCDTPALGTDATSTALTALTDAGRRVTELIDTMTSPAQLRAVLDSGVTWWCTTCVEQLVPSHPAVRGPVSRAIVSLCDEPRTAREVYARLRRTRRRTSIDSVYTTLSRLTSAGVLERTDHRYCVVSPA